MFLLQDLRFALRTLGRSPAFVAVVVLLLALGIAANTAIFSVVEAVLLRPLPYRDPGRLCMLFKAVSARHLDWDWTSYPTIRDWQRQNHSFDDIAFVLRPEGSLVTLTSGEPPETLQASKVSGNLFAVLGVQPMLGRTFSPSETEHGALLVVLSYRLWQQRFGGASHDPGNVLGKVLEIDHAPATIVGVMPDSFRFPDRETQLWLPIAADSRWPSFQKFRVADAFSAVGRLKSGVEMGQARADMGGIAGRLAQQYPATDAGLGIRVMPLADQLTPPHTRRALWTLFGAVGCLLAMTCLNVAGLVLTRGSARQRELAVRTALGAGRGRLVAQLLTESLILSFAGGGLGLLLAGAAVPALLAVAPAKLPRVDEAGVDLGLFAFVAMVSAVSALLFGLAPAFRLAQRDPQEVLRGGGRGSSGGPGDSRGRGVLVAAEFAVALVLLAGSGLLMRSFLHIRAVKLGFDPTHVATMDLHLPSPAYDGEEAARSFVGQAIQRIASLPGVTGAAAGGLFSEHQPNTAIVPEGQRGVAVAPETHGRQYVSANYFRVLGIPLYRGRGFTAADNLHARPVAVINRAMARRFWPNQDPLGRRFKQVLPGLDGDWLTVVGVVGDVLLNGRESRVVPMFYRPRSQIGFAEVSLVARTAADPLSLAAAIRREVRALDPSVPHFEIFTVDERLETMESARRFETKLLSIFAGLALLLATIGIYGLLHYRGNRADARDGYPHRARSTADPRGALDLGARPGVGRAGHRSRCRDCAAGDAAVAELALRRRRYRSMDVYWRRVAVAAGGRNRQQPAGAAGGRNRSAHRVARRVGGTAMPIKPIKPPCARLSFSP
jgi:putative ABC transport system permease protein